MPALGLHTGPSRLRINNESGDKTITKVKVTPAPTNGGPPFAEQAVAIPPSESHEFPREPPAVSWTSYTVEVTYTQDGMNHDTASAECHHNESVEPIMMIDAYFNSTGESAVLELWVRSDGMPFTLCTC